MHSIYHDVYIKSTPKNTFNYIADPKHLINWWPLKCTGDSKIGGKYNFYFDPAYDWWGEVIKYDEGQAFHIKMIDADEDWNSTSFGFDLRVEGEGLWLEFWHKGWPEINHHFKRSSHCWAMLLHGLKEYIEEGKVIPFGERS